MQNTNVGSKAGVMIRETMAPDRGEAFMLASSAKGVALQVRSATNGATVSTSGPLKNPPTWVRLDRAGNTFTAYQSADGVTWTKVGNTVTAAMSANAFVGLAVTSHNADATTTAMIDHVALNGTAACGYSVTPSGQSVSAGGGAATFGVTTSSGCTWAATSSDTSWLTVSTATGTGNGTVTASATANGGAARSATVTVAGQAFTVSQAAGACVYTISPATQSFAAGGDTGTITVTSSSWCSWSAASSDPSWLTITSGASGSGSGAITLSAAANSGGPRTASVKIADQTFSASQAGASCSYTLSPASQAFSPDGDTGTFTVNTGSGCSWNAVSSAGWLTVTSGASGVGNGTVSLNAAANTGGSRVASVTVGGQAFTGSQAAAAAPVGWSNQDIGAVGVAGSTSQSPSGVITVAGAGADVWGTADALQYAFQPLTGDGSIVARVVAVQNVNAWTKAGVMIRRDDGFRVRRRVSCWCHRAKGSRSSGDPRRTDPARAPVEPWTPRHIGFDWTAQATRSAPISQRMASSGHSSIPIRSRWAPPF